MAGTEAGESDGHAPRPGGGGRTPRTSGRGRNIFGINGSKDYRDWMGRLAEHNRTNMTALVDQALLHYARHIGFDEPPPKR